MMRGTRSEEAKFIPDQQTFIPDAYDHVTTAFQWEEARTMGNVLPDGGLR